MCPIRERSRIWNTSSRITNGEGLLVPAMHFRRRAGRFNRGKGFDNLVSVP
jgi:hypothetical protein